MKPMTASKLRDLTCKDLAKMAKSEGVEGWHSMRKEELVAALAKASRRERRRQQAAPKGRSAGAKPTATKQNTRRSTASSTNGKSAKPTPVRPTAARRKAIARIDQLKSRLAEQKNLAAEQSQPKDGDEHVFESDKVVLMVRDAYWLQAYWEVRAQSVERARTALGQGWHGAVPIVRLLRVADDGSSTLVRDITIHGGVNHWYIDVSESPCSFRSELGYRSENGDFYCVARSNTVTTPRPGSVDAMNGSWGDVAANADRIFAMSGGYSDRGASAELQQLLEDRLQRRLGRPTETRFGNGCYNGGNPVLQFAIDAEIVVFGAAESSAHVTVDGEPVSMQSDGTFAVRMHLPDRRQVIPIVASTADGTEQKTIILGVERNTKELETVTRESSNK